VQAAEAAETAARSITHPGRHAAALAGVADPLAAAGLDERGRDGGAGRAGRAGSGDDGTVHHPPGPAGQGADQGRGSADGLTVCARQPARARRLIAHAWAVGHWTEPLNAIGPLAQSALLAVYADRLGTGDS